MDLAAQEVTNPQAIEPPGAAHHLLDLVVVVHTSAVTGRGERVLEAEPLGEDEEVGPLRPGTVIRHRNRRTVTAVRTLTFGQGVTVRARQTLRVEVANQKIVARLLVQKFGYRELYHKSLLGN